MFQRIWIIPGKLAAEPNGAADGIGGVIDPGIIVLNSDFVNYDDVKEHFYKVCNMTDAQLVMTRFKKAKSHKDTLLKQAATAEYHRRKAAARSGASV